MEKLASLKKLAEAMKIEIENKEIQCQELRKATNYSNKFIGELREVTKNDIFKAIHMEESGRYILGIHDVYGYI